MVSDAKSGSFDTTKPKHVIFLGAGASKGSGYPTADEFRILLASKDKILDTITAEHGWDKRPPTPDLIGPLTDWLSQRGETIRLLREGGFGTVDEFCYLARGQCPDQVADMKRILRLCLGFRNPEENFQNSEYYGFAQKLFASDVPISLRNDVSVLTFNYDCYLDFLLQRAVRTRLKIAAGPAKASFPTGTQEPDVDTLCRITSGFYGRDISRLESLSGFFYLNLHGTINCAAAQVTIAGVRQNPSFSLEDYFEGNAEHRVRKLIGTETSAVVPPIFFPWELFPDQKGFVAEKAFIWPEPPATVRKRGGYDPQASLYELYCAIWKRAREEVQSATKISFVGLSMHEYLNHGFTMLFEGREREAEFVFANKDLERFRGDASDAHTNPLSPVTRFRKLLVRACPRLKGAVSPAITEGWGTGPRVRLLETFKEFIRTEM